jgi:hypothetical protein
MLARIGSNYPVVAYFIFRIKEQGCPDFFHLPDLPPEVLNLAYRGRVFYIPATRRFLMCVLHITDQAKDL